MKNIRYVLALVFYFFGNIAGVPSWLFTIIHESFYEIGDAIYPEGKSEDWL
jgi:hypothetical protein